VYKDPVLMMMNLLLSTGQVLPNNNITISMCKKYFFLVVGRAGGVPHGGVGRGRHQQHPAGGGVGPGEGGGLQLLVLVDRLHHPGGGRLAVPVGVGCAGGPLPTVSQTGPVRQVICNITSSFLQ
jgi:hypothetical protein